MEKLTEEEVLRRKAAFVREVGEIFSRLDEERPPEHVEILERAFDKIKQEKAA